AFSRVPNVEIAALCDVDDTVLRQRRSEVGGSARVFTDVRRLLEDQSLDAISIAAPNHWHALMAIWACQAGKDVYVEKPCSHNMWEGRQLVRAASKYGRIVQHGTQSRSARALIEAIDQVDDARWGLGVALPNRVFAGGGHFMFDDDQETPNTLNCVFEFDQPGGRRKLMEFEVRHWITNDEAGIRGGLLNRHNTIG